MLAALIFVAFSVCCFATALRAHFRSRGPRFTDDCAPAEAAVPPCRPALDPVPLAEVEWTADIPREPAEEVPLDGSEETTASFPPDLHLNIFRRGIGGGETLVAVVGWDGQRVRWSPRGLPPEALAGLQGLVLERTGLWPGHGRAYVMGVLAALGGADGESCWRAETLLRKTA